MDEQRLTARQLEDLDELAKARNLLSMAQAELYKLKHPTWKSIDKIGEVWCQLGVESEIVIGIRENEARHGSD